MIRRRVLLAGMAVGLSGQLSFAQRQVLARSFVVGILLQGARSEAADDLKDALRSMRFGEGRA